MIGQIEESAERFRTECETDAVGIWQIVKAASAAQSTYGVAAIAVAIARLVLADGTVVLGQFDEGKFVQWEGDVEQQLHRLEREIVTRDARVDIGDIGWLVTKAGA